MKKKYLVCGAGGFIGGHLVKSLLNDGHEVIGVDLKPLENWFQIFDSSNNFSLDLKEYENLTELSQEYNLTQALEIKINKLKFNRNYAIFVAVGIFIGIWVLTPIVLTEVRLQIAHGSMSCLLRD